MLCATTLWQCDFYCQRVLTVTGIRDLFLPVSQHAETRRVGLRSN